MMTTLHNIVDEANRLMTQAEGENLHLRLIGGLAVRMHSPDIERFNFRREYPDIDFVVYRKEQRRLTPFFIQMGYLPDKAFNALNGGHRQIFHNHKNDRHIDVFIGDFEMCHKLPMRNRLGLHPMTVPLAELFLSKTQIVQLNRKDALDLIGLLLDNELGAGDDGKINLDRLASLCARDWGLYKTTTLNLDRLEGILASDHLGMDDDQVHLVLLRIQQIRQALQRARKPLMWKARDRLGTRLRWYMEVEEVNRDGGQD
jgi:hypothetical protein